MARTHSPDFFHCNNCGEEVSLKAKSCPHCGADDETAWKDGIHSHLVAEDDFDYEEVMQREVHGRVPAKAGPKWWVVLLAILLLGLMAWRLLS
jgi:zinc-ribbon domain